MIPSDITRSLSCELVNISELTVLAVRLCSFFSKLTPSYSENSNENETVRLHPKQPRDFHQTEYTNSDRKKHIFI